MDDDFEDDGIDFYGVNLPIEALKSKVKANVWYNKEKPLELI